MTRAFVALGSNLGDPRGQLERACEALARLPATQLAARSRLYRTPPWGMTAQPPFLNAVAMLETTLAPNTLLEALLAIERAAGRVRGTERWGPRTLDLDLLHMEETVLDTPELTLPHPRIAERAFVLLPLADLAPDLVLPGLGRVDVLLAGVETQGCVPLA
ncbi:2-amino-4-hydroxy-6-hydroxymethyldihydropteridine diphosphokinase [Aerosticca soli]|jgi:2-amino-4-hydroxy-6-hydroxymethyldihydropteridine diphosphokinase|uniref:2-amino-4-hydroxy-6-hydroxymethyldihydropteridine pyrophosphokinase n=1 Tax=Aerosticca soli TaxID=2010829 RepID=A0A2Z6E7D6_9GAMM|nr:2-amino-4-hydroxy-6-hydroxymethyldihydropteridine diphosphokinase [Aerosticca soli]BBD80584.1 2-amino-4-hydroxy-6-hydroxymethyldihydropteridine pyrophosphokinase [Aerosticca soli]